MKNLMKFSLLLAVVLTTAGTYASTVDFSLLVKNEEGKTVRFTMNAGEKTNLYLYDQNQELLFSEMTSFSGTISRLYDLNDLPVGTYFLEAVSSTKSSTYEISVTSSGAFLNEKAVSEYYKPVLVYRGGIVTLSVLNFKSAPVAITIYDSENNEVFSDTYDSKLNFFKKFDVSKIAKGKYTFEVSYSNKSYVETVSTK